MVTVTEDAKVMLNDVLDKALGTMPTPVPARDRVGLRVTVQNKQLALGVDSPHEDDLKVDYDGNPVLLVGPDVEQLLDGTTIGVTQTPKGKQLTISR